MCREEGKGTFRIVLEPRSTFFKHNSRVPQYEKKKGECIVQVEVGEEKNVHLYLPD